MTYKIFWKNEMTPQGIKTKRYLIKGGGLIPSNNKYKIMPYITPLHGEGVHHKNISKLVKHTL